MVVAGGSDPGFPESETPAMVGPESEAAQIFFCKSG